MRLKQFLQKYAVGSPMGGDPNDPGSAATDEAAHADLRRVQRTNEIYFRIYFALLVGMFLLSAGLALVLRQEMGGLAVVLGAGGVVQGGLVVRLSSELREKVRIDTVAVLSRRLKGAQLQAVLRELLLQMRK